MFEIKSYLQFRNTPNNKPRVLVEGVDYNLKTMESLHKYLDFDRDVAEEVAILYDDVVVARLADCRPLLTVEIDGVEWTEGDVVEFKRTIGGGWGNAKGDKSIIRWIQNGSFVGLGFRKDVPLTQNKTRYIKKIGTCFKYSKPLWNCSEEEGWEKVFKLLNITK